MNELERRMVDVLTDLRENHNVWGVKAEFEAEGTRLEEALRLKDVITKAGLDLTVKIGGCEALADMYTARSIGVEAIVAPMVETPYALQKFLDATRLAFPADESQTTSFLVNIETKTACENFDDMMSLPGIDRLDGVVLGRVDLCGSLGHKEREYVNSPEVLYLATYVFQRAFGIDRVIGGGVSKETLAFIEKFPPDTVHRYETRKVIFRCTGALQPGADKGILKAVGFELMWLKNKRDYYGLIHHEDAQRIAMLEQRYNALIAEAGGFVG